jgi:ribosome-binding ATPase YchF (GTP1/OBG family)
MKLGIIGKPQAGKTTLFNAAAGRAETVGDFSRAVHRAVIKVPDERVEKLAELVKPQKTTHAEIEFLDAPGFTGQGKRSATTEVNPEVRLMDALMLVIDAFSPDANPEGDIQNLIDETFLADQVLIEGVIEKRSRHAKLTGDKTEMQHIELLHRCLKALEDGQPLIDRQFDAEELKALSGYRFLTLMPLLIVIDIREEDIVRADTIRNRFARFAEPSKRELAVICGKIEAELVLLEDDDRKLFMEEIGIATPAMQKVIERSYSLLGLISFLTLIGPEVRAWTIRKGTCALNAAGVVHSDMERGFIRAEVASYDDYILHQTLPLVLKQADILMRARDVQLKDSRDDKRSKQMLLVQSYG